MKLVGVLLLAAAASRAGWLWFGPKAKSVWRDRTIAVDGQDADWSGIEQIEDQGLTFAFANDALDLFVLLVPHSRMYRNELAGVYEQDFTVWFDPTGEMVKKIGVRLTAPPSGSPEAGRDFELVHEGDRDPPGCETADLKMGPMDAHGVVEARVPLACFGARPGERFSVGFETSPAKKPPAKKPGEHFDRLYTWVRVRPAPPR